MPPVVASTYGRYQDSFSLVAIVISSDDKKGSETQLFLEPYLRTPSGTRTLDPLIKSQLLYQLS